MKDSQLTRYARTAALALVALSALAAAPAHASESESWLVGTSTGVTAASTAPGARVAPGIRVVDGMSRSRLESLPGVRWVEPNRRFRASGVSSPSDPLFGSQWALHSARVPGAWKTTVGGDVTVAVLDSGVDLSNAELAGNLWTNGAEIARNGADDDGNGYVDDVYGADVVNHDGQPADGYGHGTEVASIIGARGNDGVGMSGVDWHVRLMPVKVLHDDGWGTTLTLIEGLRYALAKGARIVNMSVNGPDRSQALDEAIRQAEAQGVLVVTSAGNDGSDRDSVASYPASVDSAAVITVASTNRAGALASDSGFGRRSVDIAAPGDDVLTARLGGGYASSSGTSFAAAYVSGAAALLASARPNASGTQLRRALIASARRGGAVDSSIAGGRLDATAALAKLTGRATPAKRGKTSRKQARRSCAASARRSRRGAARRLHGAARRARGKRVKGCAQRVSRGRGRAPAGGRGR